MSTSFTRHPEIPAASAPNHVIAPDNSAVQWRRWRRRPLSDYAERLRSAAVQRHRAARTARLPQGRIPAQVCLGFASRQDGSETAANHQSINHGVKIEVKPSRNPKNLVHLPYELESRETHTHVHMKFKSKQCINLYAKHICNNNQNKPVKRK